MSSNLSDRATILMDGVAAAFASGSKKRLKRTEAMTILARCDGQRSRQAAAAASEEPTTMTILVMETTFFRAGTASTEFVAGIDRDALRANLAIRLEQEVRANGGMGQGDGYDFPATAAIHAKRRSDMLRDMPRDASIEHLLAWAKRQESIAPNAGPIEEVTISLRAGLRSDDVSSVILMQKHDAELDLVYTAGGHNIDSALRALADLLADRWPSIIGNGYRSPTGRILTATEARRTAGSMWTLDDCGIPAPGTQVDPRNLTSEQLVKAFDTVLGDTVADVPMQAMWWTPVAIV